MAFRYYCSECGDFKVDREITFDDEGFRNPILCKSCGTECTGLGEDPRLEVLNLLVIDLGKSRGVYQKRIAAVKNLTNQIKEDWGVGNFPKPKVKKS